MKLIIVSPMTRAAMLAAATAPWHETGRQREDGMWEYSIQDSTYQILRDNQMEGETIDDTTLRLAVTHTQRRH